MHPHSSDLCPLAHMKQMDLAPPSKAPISEVRINRGRNHVSETARFVLTLLANSTILLLNQTFVFQVPKEY